MLQLVDEYYHEDVNLLYVTESIPTEQTEDDYYTQIEKFCTCTDLCTTENNCECLLNSGATYNYTDINKIEFYQININNTNKPIFECNRNCKCNIKCGNRLVQFGPRKNLKVVKCENTSDQATTMKQYTKGLGLITSEDIGENSFICEYAGEIITKSEANKRFKQNEMFNKMNYIFCIKEHCGGNCLSTFIDPSMFGNIGRYINHSCKPNCKLIPIRVNNIIPKLCIFSQQKITANNELTFDYGDGNLGFKNVPNGIVPCLCFSSNCRKYMPYSEDIAK